MGVLRLLHHGVVVGALKIRIKPIGFKALHVHSGGIGTVAGHAPGNRKPCSLASNKASIAPPGAMAVSH